MTRCPQCNTAGAMPCEVCRAHLREWLDRDLTPRPAIASFAMDGEPFPWWRSSHSGEHMWLRWFDFHGFAAPPTYLGERSARVGPDDVDVKQRCGCEQCRPVAESSHE